MLFGIFASVEKNLGTGSLPLEREHSLLAVDQNQIRSVSFAQNRVGSASVGKKRQRPVAPDRTKRGPKPKFSKGQSSGGVKFLAYFKQCILILIPLCDFHI